MLYLMKTLLVCLPLLLMVSAALGADRIEVHGHRGARGVRPENTMPAFEYAISQGVDVLELDMAITKDGVVVVSHDPILKAPICSGPAPEAKIHQHTLAELRKWDCGGNRNPQFPRQQLTAGTRIPTLDEVFALAPKGKFSFNIETKITPKEQEAGLQPPPAEFVKLVLAEIRKHHLENRVILQSFDFRTLHEMKKIAPEIKLSALYTGPAKSFVEIAKEAGASVVSPEYRLVTPDEVQAAHSAGIKVVPWTANEPADWDKLIAARVDAIISDDPAALIAYLKKR